MVRNRATRLIYTVAALLAIALPFAAHATGAQPVGSGVKYTCQTSAPAPINSAREWVRCSDGATMYTTASNVDMVRPSISVGSLSLGAFSVANASGGYALQLPGSDGQCLISSSTSPTGWTTGACGGGGGSGTVTSITASSPLTGGTITTSGSIGLATSGVTASSYTSANITVDTYGRVTAASNGSTVANYSFSGNSVDLTGAATMSIGPTTAMAIQLGNSSAATTVLGGLTVSAAKNITAISGAGGIDFSAASGTLKPPTGGIVAPLISGGLTASGSAANDFSNSTGTFLTSSGNVSLGASGVTATVQSFGTTFKESGAHNYASSSCSSSSCSAGSGTYFADVTATSTTAVAYTLPSFASPGREIIVYDGGGAAATHNITVGVGSGTINGTSTFVMATNYQRQSFVSDGTNWFTGAVSSGGGAVSSVANSDGTLTISPTTGSVVASLALGHANTWTASQTLTAPIIASGLTASGSAANDFSASSGAFKTSTGLTTIGGAITVNGASATNTIKSGQAEATGPAHVLDTTTTYGSATNPLLAVRTNGIPVLNLFAGGGTTYLNAYNSSTGALLGGLQFVAGGVAVPGIILPATTNSYSNGTASALWASVWSSWYHTAKGSQLTAASTITPTNGLHHITGATTINIIATTFLPSGANVTVTFIADSTITFGSSGSAGGISVAPTSSLATGKAMTFVYDPGTTLWYVQQGG